MSNQRLDICSPRKKKDGGTYWCKIGTAWQSDKGIQLVFDALPLPDAEGRCVANLSEPRDNGGQQRRTTQQAVRSLADDLDDQVPF